RDAAQSDRQDPETRAPRSVVTRPSPLRAHLGQLILFTRDVPRLTAFYRDVLGFGEYEASPTFAVLNAGGVKLALHYIPSPALDSPPAAPVRRDDSAWKPTFLVEDFDAVVAHLTSHGVAMSAPTSYANRTF